MRVRKIAKVQSRIALIGVVLILMTGCQSLVAPLQMLATLASTPTAPSLSNGTDATLLEQPATPSTTVSVEEIPPVTVAIAKATPQPTTLDDIHLIVRTEGDGPNIWILDGDGVTRFHPGDSLIVYGVLIQGTETAIAQVQVIAQNPTSLLVQVMLVHPGQDVRSGLRADANLAMLEESMLIPAADFADGYVLADRRIRLRPGHDLAVGTRFQAYEAQKIGQRISDYLPFTPPILMQVMAIGVTGEVAAAELISGEWPQVGTLVSNAGVDPAPTATDTPIPELPTATSLPTVAVTATSLPTVAVTPDMVATGVAEQNMQQAAIAATLTAQIARPTVNLPVNTPIPSARTIEILDPTWSESRQGWQTVRWRYTGALQPGQGFDLILWYIEEDRRRGITDARAIAEKLERHANNEYSVLINFSAAAAVEQYCDAKYLLAVTVVELEPYRQIGPQSAGVQIQVAPLPGGACD